MPGSVQGAEFTKQQGSFYPPGILSSRGRQIPEQVALQCKQKVWFKCSGTQVREQLRILEDETEDEMAGWHPQLDGHEFEQALGVGDGQGSLVCCSPWGHKELDTTKQLN